MRELLLTVLILLIQRRQVNCKSHFEYISDRLYNVKDSMVSSLKLVRDEVLRVFRVFSTAVTRDTAYMRRRYNQERRRRYYSHSLFNPTLPAAIHRRINKDERPDVRCTFSDCTPHSFTTPQLSGSDGRIMETHVTYTSDGYVLTLHRLTSCKANSQQHGRTVLLHHGLMGSSADWILLGPNSLPYILSDAGHDIWMANSRGNYYSRAHESMDDNSEKYWNFSWQEIGEYDLPATIDYIRNTKNSTEPIDYIGHSMGATALLVLLSVKPKYNNYLRIAILLAPLVLMSNTGGPLRMLASMDDDELERVLGTKEFMPDRKILTPLLLKFCHEPEDYCNNPLFFITGMPLQNDTQTDEFKNKLNKFVPAGGSTKTIRHYLELIKNKEFHRYGTPDVKFELQNISTPILIISSNDDFISKVDDNLRLYLSIGNALGHIIIKNENLSHTEFAWSSAAEMLFYYKIKDIIDVGPSFNHISR